MRLTDLLAELDRFRIYGDPGGVRVTGVTCHSADAAPGRVFVCIRGLKHDGHRFIDKARRRGAAAFVVDRDYAVSAGPLPFIQVSDTRRAYALLCAAFAGHPARRLHITGVTGTNGKTTTAFFLDAIYRAAGFKTGLATTVFSRIGDATAPQRLTTPEAGALQSLLARMQRARVERTVLEISSHALDMHRVAGIRLQGAVLTNLARDHLDYHGGWASYRAAKGRIFSLLDDDGVAVLNGDDPAGQHFARVGRRGVPLQIVTYSLRRRPGQLGATRGVTGDIAAGPDRSLLRIDAHQECVVAAIPGPGAAFASNALAAAATAWALGIPLSTIARGLADAAPPPGRFQEICAGQPFRVFVDFAHNPTGLAHALRAVRAVLRGRLHLVFGCKGDDGDEAKRRLMGRVAARCADDIIVTTDNPFFECPRRIADLVAGSVAEAASPGQSVRIILNRAAAICTAMARARPGDVVLIAGRGHEREQRFGHTTTALDDAAVAAEWLQTRRLRTRRLRTRRLRPAPV